MPSKTFTPVFLSREQIEEIQRNQTELYGGLSGIRDENLLESAVHTPQQTFGQEFLHEDIYAMAAAYAFHIAENQPFHDGNKRTGMAASLFFLKWNSIEIQVNQMEFEGLMRGIASKEHTKEDIAAFLRQVDRDIEG